MRPNVLIVEDSPILALALADMVHEDLASEPIMSRKVSEALQKIPDHLALGLLDIEVLDGLSYPVARKLKENRIPFIFVSASAEGAIPDDLMAAPFLAKPVNMGALVKLAKSMIGIPTKF